MKRNVAELGKATRMEEQNRDTQTINMMRRVNGLRLYHAYRLSFCVSSVNPALPLVVIGRAAEVEPLET
jgi:hypothetical protein